MRFMEEKENVLFICSPGVGKTHLATALAIEASRNHYRAYFINCHELIEKLKQAYKESRLEGMLRKYVGYRLLVIDEIGYLPIDELGSNLFFQLIAKLYEKKSTIITTNIPLSQWGKTFSNPTIANAILDRLVHHSKVIKINGPSYRMKDQLREQLEETQNRKNDHF